MATRKAKKGTMQKQVDLFKKRVKDFHNDALHVSDNLVDTSLSAGAKWQKLMAKSLDQGTDLVGKQNDILLDTMEELKDQFKYGRKRFVKLMGFEKATKEVKKTVKKRVKKVEKSVAKKKTVKVSSKSDNVVDDLTMIDGIGKKFATLLNAAGIKNLRQLASAEVAELKVVLAKAGPMFKSFDPTRWIEQAKLMIEGKVTK